MRVPSAGATIAALGVSWLAGIALQQQEPWLRPLSLYGVAAVLAVSIASLARLAWRPPRRATRSGSRRAATGPIRVAALAAAALAAAVAGYATTGARAVLRLADPLPAALEGRDVVVTGVVAALPQRGPAGSRFRFVVDDDARRVDGLSLPAQLSIGWYGAAHEDAAALAPQRELRAGQRWRLALRLRRPHGNLNPHGFDYELWLFEQGLAATGYVRDAPPPQLLAEAAGFPVERLRQRVRDAIERHVADRRAAGVLAALAIGDQGAIDRADWELFRNTGIAHLVSISGLHVTMFAWLIGLVVGAAWRRSDRAVHLLPAAQAARWGGLAAALAYAVFSGWGVPAQRTVWMLAVVAGLRSAGIRWPWPLVLLAAAVAVTAIDPWALLQPGFWLSFAAVGLLIASSPVTGAAGEDRSAGSAG